MQDGPIRNVKIAGIACAAPALEADPAPYIENFGAEDVEKIISMSGTRKRRIAEQIHPRMCVSDLAAAAAPRLLDELGWERSSVEALILITQAPDYRLPATACILQARLGLPKTCIAFDVNLGCSGYIYGLWLAGTMIASGSVKRVLLAVGDTSYYGSPLDRSAALLFGDAAAVTALEFSEDAEPMWFTLGTDGRGYKDLIIPAGGNRIPPGPETSVRKLAENGNIRSMEDLYMNGSEIFTFTLREVPAVIKSAIQKAGWTLETPDAFVLHQANAFMVEHIAKRMKVPMSKVPLSLGEFGNTSSASIPLTIAHCLRQQVEKESMNLAMCGFGVGLSWGALAMKFGPTVVTPVIDVDRSAIMAYGTELRV